MDTLSIPAGSDVDTTALIVGGFSNGNDAVIVKSEGTHHPKDLRHEACLFHHPDLTRLQSWRSMQAEADLPEGRWDEERRWALRMGLTGADSIEDKSIPTIARGELPHYAGINTFLKAPYSEDVTEVKHYDATVIGIPFDGGTTTATTTCTVTSSEKMGRQIYRRLQPNSSTVSFRRPTKRPISGLSEFLSKSPESQGISP